MSEAAIVSAVGVRVVVHVWKRGASVIYEMAGVINFQIYLRQPSD